MAKKKRREQGRLHTLRSTVILYSIKRKPKNKSCEKEIETPPQIKSQIKHDIKQIKKQTNKLALCTKEMTHYLCSFILAMKPRRKCLTIVKHRAQI